MSESVSCGLDGRLVGADKAERGRTKARAESTLMREKGRGGTRIAKFAKFV